MIYVCSLKDDKKASSEGKVVLKTIEEAYKVIPHKETREIIMKDKFVERYFTPSGFASFVRECSRINKFLEIIYNPKYSLHSDDKVKNLDEIEDSQQSKLSNMHLELWETKCLWEQELEEHNKTRNKLAKVSAELDAMISSINYKFGRAANVEKYSGINISACNYRKILYIKEITRVHYVDTLLYYLQEIIKSVQLKQARLMVIEAAYSGSRIALYPRCKPYSGLTGWEVLDGNIYIAGFQADVVESVLKNSSNSEYLIILDRSGYENMHVMGKSVESLYTVSDLEDVKFNVSLSRLISYSNKTLHIPFIKNFNELASEDRADKYYSMEITKAILEMLERKD